MLQLLATGNTTELKDFVPVWPRTQLGTELSPLKTSAHQFILPKIVIKEVAAIKKRKNGTERNGERQKTPERKKSPSSYYS